MLKSVYLDSNYPIGEKPLTICHASHINVHALMTYDYLVIDKEAVEVLEEMYSSSQTEDDSKDDSSLVRD